MHKPRLDIIIPAYNEVESLPHIMPALTKALEGADVDWSVILVDDGSNPASVAAAQTLADTEKQVSLIALSRNFGKEIALSAGLQATDADAVVMMDADLQHPPRYLPQFIDAWQKDDHQVVIGVRKADGKDSWLKSLSSRLFYRFINRISDTHLIPKATDYRLVTREVIDAFNAMPEKNRITRGMIDWLGFDRTVVYFDADQRLAGTASYSLRKLGQLASDSIVSMSLFPLKITFYLGMAITLFFGVLGVFVGVFKYVLDDLFGFTGPATLAILILFLVGIILTNIAFLGLYVANIHQQVKDRPLFVINKRDSRK